MNHKVDSEFLTLPIAAKKLNIPVSTLRRAVRRGDFPTYKPFGSRIRVRLSEIVSAIEEARNDYS